MNDSFIENKKYFIVFLAIFLIGLIIFIFMFTRPQNEEIKTKQNNINDLESEILILKAESEQGPSTDDIDVFKLAKKMPNAYNIDEFLLTLLEIELVSDSRVSGLELAYDQGLPTISDEDKEKSTEEDESESDEPVTSEPIETKDDEENTEELKDIFQFEDKPDNMHLITARINVASPNYKAFQRFLKEVEKQERIMFISKLEFIKPAEKELIIEDDSNETIMFSADITTFYHEEEK